MKSRNQTPKCKVNGEFSTKKSQIKIIIEFLKHHPANSKMIHLATGIPREAICRAKRDLEDINKLWVIYQDYCPHTGRLTQFLTTNRKIRDLWLSK